ncbi:MAG: cation:proton antiporter subunit C [Defluviitaleaceae bacterium]|nr:cation:proton antiporter subunit C [Defluviitaleaceae bacterium]
MDFHILDIFPVLLFFISFFGIITSGNIVKSIVMVIIMQTSVIMFWLGVGARFGTTPPIFEDITEIADPNAIADPLPQALMLTAIIIGVAVTAINITMLNALFRKYKTVEWDTMQELAVKDEGLEVQDLGGVTSESTI